MASASPFRLVGAVIVALGMCQVLANIFLDIIPQRLWPDYAAAAYPKLSFTLPMLLMRQTIGLMLMIAGGFIASDTARQDRKAVLWTALIILVYSVWDHLQEPARSQLPLWYHLLYLAYIVPAMMLGGWLNRRIAATKN